MLEYKGYIGRVDFNNDSDCFHGEVINTKDVITFQGNTAKQLQKAFKESIEDYLAFCSERGESPDRPFSGKFNVRLDPEIHKKAYLAATLAEQSLNTWVAQAILKESNPQPLPKKGQKNQKGQVSVPESFYQS